MEFSDARHDAPVTASQTVFAGRIWDVAADTVQLADADQEPVVRQYVQHPGAVAIMALDDAENVLLLQQYRHPVRSLLWEPPAGLLDVAGESLQSAAARELYEEADLIADQWHTLVDYYASPGGSTEGLRIFLARGLSAVPEAERYIRSDEERDMAHKWVPITQAVDSILAGRIHNPSAVVGILALESVRHRNWQGLRPADATWQP